MRSTLARWVPPCLVALSLAAQTPLIDQGRAALARQDVEAGIALLERAVAQTPKDAEAHYHLGLGYGAKAEQGGMFVAARFAPKARGAWEQAVALNPRHLEARFRLIEFYTMAPGLLGGSMDKALAQAQAIKALDPLLGHRAYAFVYLKQQKPDLAKREFTEALREQPTSAKAHCYLGQHLVNVEKDYAEAFATFETALKLDPAEMPAYYYLGRTAALANANHARGADAMRRYLATTPKDNEPPLANAHLRLGQIYEKSGRKAEAVHQYQSALKLDPSLKEASEALKRLL